MSMLCLREMKGTAGNAMLLRLGPRRMVLGKVSSAIRIYTAPGARPGEVTPNGSAPVVGSQSLAVAGSAAMQAG